MRSPVRPRSRPPKLRSGVQLRSVPLVYSRLSLKERASFTRLRSKRSFFSEACRYLPQRAKTPPKKKTGSHGSSVAIVHLSLEYDRSRAVRRHRAARLQIPRRSAFLVSRSRVNGKPESRPPSPVVRPQQAVIDLYVRPLRQTYLMLNYRYYI
jgi:hypothetical protein